VPEATKALGKNSEGNAKPRPARVNGKLGGPPIDGQRAVIKHGRYSHAAKAPPLGYGEPARPYRAADKRGVTNGDVEIMSKAETRKVQFTGPGSLPSAYKDSSIVTKVCLAIHVKSSQKPPGGPADMTGCPGGWFDEAWMVKPPGIL